MIARIWRGTVRPEDADRYVAYVGETGLGTIEPLRETLARTFCETIVKTGRRSSR